MAVGPTALTRSFRSLFQATMQPAGLPSTPPRNSVSQEIRPRFRTRTRTAAGTMSYRMATIGRLPRSRVELAEYCAAVRKAASAELILLRRRASSTGVTRRAPRCFDTSMTSAMAGRMRSRSNASQWPLDAASQGDLPSRGEQHFDGSIGCQTRMLCPTEMIAIAPRFAIVLNSLGESHGLARELATSTQRSMRQFRDVRNGKREDRIIRLISRFSSLPGSNSTPSNRRSQVRLWVRTRRECPPTTAPIRLRRFCGPAVGASKFRGPGFERASYRACWSSRDNRPTIRSTSESSGSPSIDIV
jgi:hypothetical protein